MLPPLDWRFAEARHGAERHADLAGSARAAEVGLPRCRNRGIEIALPACEAIAAAFDFDFDHAFGFYSGLTPAKMMREHPRYELFADIGEADPGVFGVKKTKVAQAFPAIGHTMMFLFDYGDGWHF